jgi:hypothetical protein
MVCLEYEKIWQDVMFHQKNVRYFLLDKALHKLSDAKARESAKDAALALAQASNRLYWHESQCSVCMRAKVYGSVNRESQNTKATL